MSRIQNALLPTLCAVAALLSLAGTSTGQEVREADAESIEAGQWTRDDRLRRTERFRSAMEYVATHDRTDLLGNDHECLAAYYEFLADHPIVRNADLQWPGLAAEVVRMVGLADFGGTAMEAANSLLSPLLGANAPPQLSPKARTFLDGTISATVAADVTRRVYGPLLRGETDPPGDAFLFDADTLRGEQLHPDVVSSYAALTEADRQVLDSRLARWYASESWAEAEDYDLTSAQDRIFLGLRKMSYDESQIRAYLEQQEPTP